MASKTAAIRRLGAEYKAMMNSADRNPDIFAAPLEDNFYEWHFTIRGPYTLSPESLPDATAKPSVPSSSPPSESAASSGPGWEAGSSWSAASTLASDGAVHGLNGRCLHVKEDEGVMLGYEKGLYHGALLFKSTFPYEPPDIMFFTPTGRFECNVKICSTISNYHKEHWQPTYHIDFILQSLREFMRMEDEEGVGTLNKDSVPRKLKFTYAEQSWDYKCAKCGCPSSETYDTYMAPYLTKACLTRSSAVPMTPDVSAPTASEVTASSSSTGVDDGKNVTTVEFQSELNRNDTTASPSTSEVETASNCYSEKPTVESKTSHTDIKTFLQTANTLRRRRAAGQQPEVGSVSSQDNDAGVECNCSVLPPIDTETKEKHHIPENVTPSAETPSRAEQPNASESEPLMESGPQQQTAANPNGSQQQQSFEEEPSPTVHIRMLGREINVDMKFLDKCMAIGCLLIACILLRRCACWCWSFLFV